MSKVAVEPTEQELAAAMAVLWRSMVANGAALTTHDGSVKGEQVCIVIARGKDAKVLLDGIREAMEDDGEDDEDDG